MKLFVLRNFYKITYLQIKHPWMPISSKSYSSYDNKSKSENKKEQIETQHQKINNEQKHNMNMTKCTLESVKDLNLYKKLQRRTKTNKNSNLDIKQQKKYFNEQKQNLQAEQKVQKLIQKQTQQKIEGHQKQNYLKIGICFILVFVVKGVIFKYFQKTKHSQTGLGSNKQIVQNDLLEHQETACKKYGDRPVSQPRYKLVKSIQQDLTNTQAKETQPYGKKADKM